MIQGRKVLAVVPARGGSKGIPRKNLQPLRGVPLVALVGPVISAVPIIDRAVVSTDDDEIAEVAESAGVPAPFRRPAGLSGDRVGDRDVLLHALRSTEALDDITYDIVVMLQPTSPLRTPGHVLSCIEMLVDGGWDSVWTVSETDSKHHPLKQLRVDPEGVLTYYDARGAEIVARQQLDPVFHRNGIAYAVTRDCLVNQETIKGARAGALVVRGEHVSIDTERDLAIAELMLRRNPC